MRTMEDLRHCAERCITHHEACDCKQLEYREQIERLESDLSGTQLALADYSAENIQLRKDIDQMEERLFKYGRCLPDCSGKYTGGNCNCGWETVLSEDKQAEEITTLTLKAKRHLEDYQYFYDKCRIADKENARLEKDNKQMVVGIANAIRTGFYDRIVDGGLAKKDAEQINQLTKENSLLIRRCEENGDYKQQIARLESEKTLLAMLAADTPQFNSPVLCARAKELRDKALAKVKEIK